MDVDATQYYLVMVRPMLTRFSRLLKKISAPALVLALLMSGSAEARRGDWESAGGPRLPYEPTYEYAYSCEALLSNEWGSSDADRLYAIARFELKNSRQWLKAGDLKWTWLVETAEKEIELGDLAKPPFRPQGVSIGMLLGPGSPDRVELRISVELPIGEFFVTESGEWTGDRDAQFLRAKAVARAYRAEQGDSALPAGLSRKLLVECRKIR